MNKTIIEENHKKYIKQANVNSTMLSMMTTIKFDILTKIENDKSTNAIDQKKKTPLTNLLSFSYR